MASWTLWWLMAGAAVVLELTTGTFYLLMLAIGLAAGAIAAHVGASITTQLVVAALVGGGAVVACYFVRRNKQPEPGENPDMNLDVGETVEVTAWNADGTATVKYRGANWSVICADESAPLSPGPHRVREVIGSRLVVERV